MRRNLGWDILGRLGFGKKASCNRGNRSARPFGRSLQMEHLETRELLSVTWNGAGGDNLWSTGANWVGGQVPSAGEDLVFSGTARTNTQNDLAYAFDSLTFASNNFSISGNAVLLGGDITVNSGIAGTSLPAGVSFADESEINLGYGCDLTIGGGIANADTLDIHVPSGSAMSVGGGISGTGELTLELGYGSSMTIGDGIAGSSSITMSIPSGSDLSVEGGLSEIGRLTATVGTGSSLDIDGGISAQDAITLTQSAGSTVTVDGSISNAAGLTVTGGWGAFATISGDVSGAGGLTKMGDSLLTLTGDNTYEGETTIEGGTLRVGNGGAGGSLGMGTVIDNASLVFNTSTPRRAFVIGSGSLTLSGPGTFTLDCPGTPSVSIADPNGLLIPGGVAEVTAQTVMPGVPMTLTAMIADAWSECQSVTFYHDVNANGVVDGGDTNLGTGTNDGGYWSTTVDTLGWGPTEDAVIAVATFPGNSEHPPASTQAQTNMNVRALSAIIGPADQGGYVESGNGFSTVWTADALGGRYREMSGTDPDAYVTFTFTGLSPRYYDVWTHYVLDSRFSDSVPIEVYDGDVTAGTLKQSFDLDETCLHWSNQEIDGYDWNWSGDTVYANSGTITVRIGVGSGGATRIPAVRLVSVLNSPSCGAPVSNDPVNLATGQIQSCGCGDSVEGTYYDNLSAGAGVQGDTGYGMRDGRAVLVQQGYLVTYTDERGCPGDQWALALCDEYASLHGHTKATLVKPENEDFLVLTEVNGTVHHFDVPSTSAYSVGAWRATYYPDGSSEEASYVTVDSVDKVGEIQYKSATSHAYRSELYEYIDDVEDDNLGLRESVTYRNWDPGTDGWVNESKIEYEYYESDQSGRGKIGDLKTATTYYYDGAQWSDGDVTYFRYYTGPTYEGQDYVGFAHGLKRKLMPEAYEAAEAYATSQSTTVDQLTDTQLAPYTCFYYKYNEDQRVIYEEVYGGLRTTMYEYQEGGDGYGSADLNIWTRKTVETRPSGDTYTVFTNYFGQPILTDLADSSGNHWYTYHEYHNNGGNILLEAESSAVDGYEEDEYIDGRLNVTFANSGYSGLVRKYTYYGGTDTATDQTPGSVTNYLASVGVAEGYYGTTITTAEYDYYKYTDATSGQTVYHLATQTKYTDTAAADPVETGYDPPTWHSGTVQINQEILNLPAISTDHNGENEEYETYRWYDANGNLAWTKDQAGRVTYYDHDADTDLVQYMIEDVDSDLSSGLNPPTGYEGNSDGAHLRTDFQYDLSGRLVLTLGPEHKDDTGKTVRTASGTIYNDADHEILSAGGYAWYDTSVFQWKYTLVNPVTITKTNRDGDVTDVIQATAETTTLSTTDPLGTVAAETFTQSEYVSWTTYQYSHKQLVGTRVYHTIPASGVGTATANYEQTTYGYDSLGRLDYTETAAGGITFTTYDPRGLLLSTWIGTDAVPTTDYNGDSSYDADDFRYWLAANPTATSAPAGTAMFLVGRNIYDGGADGGDGLLTESRAFYDSGASNYYATEYQYDWRGRLTDVLTPGDVVTHYEYDNLDRVTWTKTYASSDFTLAATELRAQRNDLYDDLGRVYESRVYEVDQEDAANPGTVGDYLPTETWYDARGLVVKTSDGNGLFRKFAYDGLGRQIASYLCFDTDETAYADADDVSGDTVVEQTRTWLQRGERTGRHGRLPADARRYVHGGRSVHYEFLRHRLAPLV